jgi:hypothetical protein
MLFDLFLLGTDHKEIHDRENQYQRNKLFNTTHVGAILLFYCALAETYALAPGFARWINRLTGRFFTICITSV